MAFFTYAKKAMWWNTHGKKMSLVADKFKIRAASWQFVHGGSHAHGVHNIPQGGAVSDVMYSTFTLQITKFVVPITSNEEFLPRIVKPVQLDDEQHSPPSGRLLQLIANCLYLFFTVRITLNHLQSLELQKHIPLLTIICAGYTCLFNV